MSTPGPWARGVTDSEIVGADGTLVALVLASSHSFNTLYIDPAKAKLAHVPEAQANAQLMMCADELLGTLEAVADCMLNGGDGVEGDFGWRISALTKLRPQIRSVIAKARAA